MWKRKGVCMKKLSFYRKVSFCKAIFRPIPISLVSQDCTTDWGEVNTYLMSATCFYTEFEKAILSLYILFDSSIVSDRFLSIFCNLYLCFILSILYASEFFFYGSSWFWGFADDDCVVYFFYLSWLKRREKCFKNLFFFRNQDGSTCISIDPVNEGRFKRKCIVFLIEKILHGFYKGYFSCFMVSWMYIGSCFFIYHHKSPIFIQNIETFYFFPVLCFYDGSYFLKIMYFLISEVDINHILQFYSIVLINFFSIYLYLPSPEPLIDSSERSFSEIFFQKFIDTLFTIRLGWYNKLLQIL